MISVVPFQYLAHLVTVPVLAGGMTARFVVDTGIGVTLVSQALAARAGCKPDGSAYTGRRMSGHPVTLPLRSLRSLRVGDLGAEDVTVGIFDMSEMAGLGGIDGFLGLDFFRSAPVTIDYPTGAVVVEDADSLARRARTGVPAGVRVEHDQCSTSVFLPLEVPGAGSLAVEVDTGSDVLIRGGGPGRAGHSPGRGA